MWVKTENYDVLTYGGLLVTTGFACGLYAGFLSGAYACLVWIQS